jgi:hypothetical protein
MMSIFYNIAIKAAIGTVFHMATGIRYLERKDGKNVSYK